MKREHSAKTTKDIKLSEDRFVRIDWGWYTEHPNHDPDTWVLMSGDREFGYVRLDNREMQEHETLRQYKERQARPYIVKMGSRVEAWLPNVATLEEAKASAEDAAVRYLERHLEGIEGIKFSL